MSRGDTETRRVQRIYDRMAPRYDRVIAVAERALFAGGREWATSHAHGDVVELGVGTGRNLPLFPADARVVGIDVSPRMLDIARRRAEALGRSFDLRLGDAQALDLPDASVDVVVSTLTMCSIPDAAAAVREAARVLRPGGRLVLLEHVASDRPAVLSAQRLLEPLAVRLQGDHLLREPEQQVREAGLRIDLVERTRLGITLRLLAHRR